MRHHFHVSLVQTFLTLPHDYLLQYAMPIEKEFSEKIKKTQANNQEVQNFQEILAVLKEEHSFL
jgi:hypothetical protein